MHVCVEYITSTCTCTLSVLLKMETCVAVHTVCNVQSRTIFAHAHSLVDNGIIHSLHY